MQRSAWYRRRWFWLSTCLILAASYDLFTVRYFVDTPTYVAELEGPTSQTFELEPNYPNPFNSGTVIPFALTQGGEMRLDIYNSLGQRVATLAEGYREAGRYRSSWNGLDAAGRVQASGIYLARLQSDTESQSRRLLLLRRTIDNEPGSARRDFG